MADDDEYQGPTAGVDALTGKPVPDPTGEAQSGTMSGEGPGTGGNKIPGRAPEAKAIAPAGDVTAPGSGATTKPEPISQDADQYGKGATQKDLASHAYDLVKQADEDQKRARQYYLSIAERVNQIESEPKPEMPALKAYPVEPNLTDEQKRGKRAMIAFGMIGAVAALAFGRKGSAGSSFRGIAEGIQQIKAGMQTDMKEKYALFRTEVQAIHEENQERLSSYKDLMAARNSDVHEKLEAVKTVADAYKDVATSNAAATGNIEKFSEYLSRLEKLQADMRDKVISKMDDIGKFFGTHDGELYRSWGAEKYPELSGALFSQNPAIKAQAFQALAKKKPYYEWYKENYKYLHAGETAAEKKEEQEELLHPGSNKAPSGDELDEQIRSLGSDLWGGNETSENDGDENEKARDLIRRAEAARKSFNPENPFE